MMNIDLGFILSTVLVFGGLAGALLCSRHMMHEEHDVKSNRNEDSKHELRAPIQH